MAEDANASYPRLVKRSYTQHPVKMVEFELPYRQSIVYLDITQGECEEMLLDGKIFMQSFYLEEQAFYLFARCNENDLNSSHGFGLFLVMEEEDGSVGLTLDCEFAARKKPSKKFVSIANWEQPFIGGEAIGWDNLFKMSLTAFMAKCSPYLIDGVLH